MLLLLVATTLSAVFGSFFNVVVWRLPRGESIVHPPSHCPGCGTPIPWYRNIPVVTWLVQRGRCAHCGCAISARYVLVEAFCGILGLGWAILALSGLWTDPGLAVAWIVFALAGVPIALIDWDTFEIPDGLVVCAGVGGGLFRIGLSADPWASCIPVLHDGLLAAGFLYAISFSSRVGLAWLGSCVRAILHGTKPRRRRGMVRPVLRLLLRWSRFDVDVEALGLGDVSLGLAAGVALGFQPVLIGLPLAALLGILGHIAVSGITGRAKDAGLDPQSIPFGPFLVAGFLVAAVLLAGAV